MTQRRKKSYKPYHRFPLAVALSLALGGAALAADISYLYVANDTSGAITVFQDGKQLCTIAPRGYCDPAPGIPDGASSTLRFVFADGSERSIVWSQGSGLHFCLEEGARITDCRGTDIS